MDPDKSVARAYDGSTSTFRVLRAFGWGPLLNLGYHARRDLWRLPFGTGFFQRRLARRSIALVGAAPGQIVVDVACGRGWTSAELARSGARVLGIDLLPEHVQAASEAWRDVPDLRFAAGDATRLADTLARLDIAPGTVDAVHCLEAAFEFGAAGRRAFLADVFRMLRPGGRLVLVDFTWRSDDPGEIDALDPTRRVRQAWGFEQFEPLERYRRVASDIGFRERAFHDWSVPVMDRFQRVASAFVWALQSRAVRAVVALVRPGIRKLADAEWPQLREAMRAHDRVRRHSRYVAFVLEKPPATTPGDPR
jgi:SAM-dependent methyltransferase